MNFVCVCRTWTIIFGFRREIILFNISLICMYVDAWNVFVFLWEETHRKENRTKLSFPFSLKIISIFQSNNERNSMFVGRTISTIIGGFRRVIFFLIGWLICTYASIMCEVFLWENGLVRLPSNCQKTNGKTKGMVHRWVFHLTFIIKN